MSNQPTEGPWCTDVAGIICAENGRPGQTTVAKLKRGSPVELLAVSAALMMAGCNYGRDAGTLTAYYADGSRTLYHPDVATQSVATFGIRANGNVYYEPFGSVMKPCNVADYRNWACPAVTNGLNGTPEAHYGFTQAIDGTVGVTDPNMLHSPISWLRWEVARIGRFLGLTNAPLE